MEVGSENIKAKIISKQHDKVVSIKLADMNVTMNGAKRK
jgi:hypothetical protein